MHHTDVVCCYGQSGMVCLYVGHNQNGWTDWDAVWRQTCVVVVTVSWDHCLIPEWPQRLAHLHKSAGRRLLSCGPKERCVRWRFALAPPGKYSGSICMAAAMQSMTTITVATCFEWANDKLIYLDCHWLDNLLLSKVLQPHCSVRLLTFNCCIDMPLAAECIVSHCVSCQCYAVVTVRQWGEDCRVCWLVCCRMVAFTC